MSLIVTLAKYCEGKSGNAFTSGGNVCGSRGNGHKAAASAMPVRSSRSAVGGHTHGRLKAQGHHKRLSPPWLPTVVDAARKGL